MSRDLRTLKCALNKNVVNNGPALQFETLKVCFAGEGGLRKYELIMFLTNETNRA